MNELVSIVVPIYNAEKYLKQCIDSIICQKYQNLEVILVDDGSKDRSFDIIQMYKKRDARVKGMHLANSGSVKARKEGTRVATGKYITYIDADDWIAVDYIGHLVNAITQCDADIVISSFCEYRDEMFGSKHICKFDDGIYEKEEIRDRIWPSMICTGTKFSFGLAPAVWGKLFVREKMLKIILDVDENISIGDDFVCTYPYIIKCKRLVIANSICEYFYRMEDNSLSRSGDSDYISHMESLFLCINRKFSGVYEDCINDQILQYKMYMLLQDGIANCERLGKKAYKIFVLTQKYWVKVNQNNVFRDSIRQGIESEKILEDWQMNTLFLLQHKLFFITEMYIFLGRNRT